MVVTAAPIAPQGSSAPGIASDSEYPSPRTSNTTHGVDGKVDTQSYQIAKTNAVIMSSSPMAARANARPTPPIMSGRSTTAIGAHTSKITDKDHRDDQGAAPVERPKSRLICPIVDDTSVMAEHRGLHLSGRASRWRRLVTELRRTTERAQYLRVCMSGKLGSITSPSGVSKYSVRSRASYRCRSSASVGRRDLCYLLDAHAFRSRSSPTPRRPV